MLAPLTESGRKDAIKELELKLSKGEITEQEYNQRKAAINSAPRVVFVDNEGISHKGEISAGNAEKNNGESVLGKISYSFPGFKKQNPFSFKNL